MSKFQEEVVEPKKQKKVKVEDPFEDIRLGGIKVKSHNWWEEPNEEQSSDEELANGE